MFDKITELISSLKADLNEQIKRSEKIKKLCDDIISGLLQTEDDYKQEYEKVNHGK